jgi:hypothetical protein
MGEEHTFSKCGTKLGYLLILRPLLLGMPPTFGLYPTHKAILVFFSVSIDTFIVRTNIVGISRNGMPTFSIPFFEMWCIVGVSTSI